MPTVEQEESPRNPVIERVRREADLPFPLVKMLEDRPGRGEGLHDWLFNPAAHNLHAHLVPASIIGLLTLLCPDATEHEICDAVANSESEAWGPGKAKWEPVSLDWLEEHAPMRRASRGSPGVPRGARPHAPAAPKWPEPDLEVIERIALAGPSLTELRAESHFDFLGEERFTKWLLPRLFPADSLLCLAGSQRSSITAPLSTWLSRHLQCYSFIVPSPMSAETGLTLDGRASFRTLSNVGARRYLVCEFDFSEYAKDRKETRYAPLIRALRGRGISILDMQAALIWHLAGLLPLVMVVFSGRISLQGWLYAAGAPEFALLAFMGGAVRLGADPATWCPCQLVRLPDGSRLNAAGLPVARQTVEYFNAEGGL
jgi:hypothetical protein